MIFAPSPLKSVWLLPLVRKFRLATRLDAAEIVHVLVRDVTACRTSGRTLTHISMLEPMSRARKRGADSKSHHELYLFDAEGHPVLVTVAATLRDSL